MSSRYQVFYLGEVGVGEGVSALCLAPLLCAVLPVVRPVRCCHIAHQHTAVPLPVLAGEAPHRLPMVDDNSRRSEASVSSIPHPPRLRVHCPSLIVNFDTRTVSGYFLCYCHCSWVYSLVEQLRGSQLGASLTWAVCAATDGDADKLIRSICGPLNVNYDRRLDALSQALPSYTLQTRDAFWYVTTVNTIHT
ncbi:hypothetical protein J6590_036708 [Homalodisca vitripennis]|nr:hypothetical protein J6590_036708 [Homalodisca vitripennis]